MRAIAKSACGVAALALLAAVAAHAGKPDKPSGKPGNDEPRTQACELTGDATGGGQVGIDAKSYGPLEMAVNEGTGLAGVLDRLGVTEQYSGLGRVLKREGRLDFHFNLDRSTCRPIVWGEEPPVGPEVCQYHLLLMNGVYDRKADDVEFGPGTTARLFDYRAVRPYVLIGDGSAALRVAF